MRLGLAAALVVLALASDARAEDAVVVLVTDTVGPFALRVRAELESMGFHVALTRQQPSDVPAGTVAVARLVDTRPPRIDVDPLGDAAAGGRTTITFEATNDPFGVGSVQVAERVRATFQPLAPRAAKPEAAEPDASPGAAPPPVATHGWLAATTPRTSPERAAGSDRAALRPTSTAPGTTDADVPDSAATLEDPSKVPLRKPWGISIAPTAGAFGPRGSLATFLSFYASPHERLRLEGFVSAPLPFVGGATLSGSDGSTAEVHVGLVGGIATATLWSTRAELSRLWGRQTFALLGSAGVAGAWIRADGDAAAGSVGRRQDAFSALMFGSVALRMQSPWSRRLFFVPRGFLGASLPTVDIQFDGKTVSRWGAPWGMITTCFEIDIGGS